MYTLTLILYLASVWLSIVSSYHDNANTLPGANYGDQQFRMVLICVAKKQRPAELR